MNQSISDKTSVPRDSTRQRIISERGFRNWNETQVETARLRIACKCHLYCQRARPDDRGRSQSASPERFQTLVEKVYSNLCLLVSYTEKDVASFTLTLRKSCYRGWRCRAKHSSKSSTMSQHRKNRGCAALKSIEERFSEKLWLAARLSPRTWPRCGHGKT